MIGKVPKCEIRPGKIVRPSGQNEKKDIECLEFENRYLIHYLLT